MTRLQFMIYNAILLNEHDFGAGYTVDECLSVAKTAFDTDKPKVEKAIGRLLKMGMIDMHFNQDESVILKAKQ